MTRLPAALLLAPLLAALLAGSAAHAQPIDLSSGGPVEVTARDGFEWQESAQTVTATGEARAVRGNATVLADQLVAHYRKKQAGVAPANAGTGTPDADTGSNEIYRLDAIGHVRIVTPTDEAVGDKAVYDIDQAVLVMTGKALKLTTPQYVLTARDSLEYWSQRHMAVGRGNAVVVASDGRRLSADVLVGYTTQGPAPAATAAKAGPVPETGGKLERLEAYGNVDVRTQTDTVRGDRGVYVPDTGVARVLGNVKVVHNGSVVSGAAADVNMKSGIGHIIADPDRRVQGLIQPNEAQGAARPATPAPPPAAAPSRGAPAR